MYQLSMKSKIAVRAVAFFATIKRELLDTTAWPSRAAQPTDRPEAYVRPQAPNLTFPRPAGHVILWDSPRVPWREER